MRRTRLQSLAFLVCCLSLFLAACEEDAIVLRNRGTNNGNAPAAAVEAEPDAEAEDLSTAYRDEDFVESELNRDPFRSYATLFRVNPGTDPTGGRDVVMPETGVDEMRLVAIITGVSNPRAMLVDRNGVGHVVRRGEFLGRSEVVQAGGTEDLPITLNWRVARVLPNRIVLSREDPTSPNQAPVTRVVPLREEEESGISLTP